MMDSRLFLTPIIEKSARRPGMVNETVLNVARDFCRLLRETLGEDELKLVVERNRTENHPSVCHTHDFCDANEVMAKAMARNGFSDPDPTDVDAAKLWGDAWTVAKSCGFDAGEVAKREGAAPGGGAFAVRPARPGGLVAKRKCRGGPGGKAIRREIIATGRSGRRVKDPAGVIPRHFSRG